MIYAFYLFWEEGRQRLPMSMKWSITQGCWMIFLKVEHLVCNDFYPDMFKSSEEQSWADIFSFLAIENLMGFQVKQSLSLFPCSV